MAQRPDTGIQYHGKKRPAESEPQDQPLVKKLGRLRIGGRRFLRVWLQYTNMISLIFI